MKTFLTAMGIMAIFLQVGCSIDDSYSKVNASVSERLKLEYEDEPFWDHGIPTDSNLNRKHPLYEYYYAAYLKKLPIRFFREIIEQGSSVVVKKGNWPRYKPGIFYGGTIYHPAASKSPHQWSRISWQSFYNELFHAWWQHVFNKHPKYQYDRSRLFTKKLKNKYILAHKNHRLAQEEAYSETVASVALYLYPTYLGKKQSSKYISLSELKYDRAKTVAAVGHSENSGYSKEAENIYPDPMEYKILFNWFTGSFPPES